MLDNWEVPEELPKSSGRVVGRILSAGAQYPPERKSAKITASGNTPRPEFTIVIEPLNFKYNSDRTMFDDDFEHAAYPMYNKNGEIANADSKFGRLKTALLKYGFPITNAESSKALIGKVFVWENRKDTVNFGTEEVPDMRDFYTLIPNEQLPDGYTHTGGTPVFDRPRKKAGAAPSAASVADNATTALPKLAKFLNGKTESEYFDALTGSGDGDVLRAPYIVEASTDAHALTMRMVDSGLMKQDGDKLVANG